MKQIINNSQIDKLVASILSQENWKDNLDVDMFFDYAASAENAESIARSVDTDDFFALGFEMAKDRVEDARTFLSEGDHVEAKLTGMDRKNRSVFLSIKAKDADEEAEARLRDPDRQQRAAPAGGFSRR